METIKKQIIKEIIESKIRTDSLNLNGYLILSRPRNTTEVFNNG